MLNSIVEDKFADAAKGLPLMKECSKCGECKTIDEFYKQKKGKFGVRSICKECESEKNREFSAKSNYPRQIEGTKVCIKCGEEKDVSEFPSAKRNKDGLNPWCKSCHSKNSKSKNYPRQIEGTKVCTKCGVEKDVSEFASHKRSRDGLHDKCRSCCAEYNKEKKERSVLVTEGTKICAMCGVEKDVEEFHKRANSLDGRHYWCRSCEYENHKRRLEDDENYKIALDLRRRLLVAVDGDYKAGSAVRDLGCTIEFFKFYLADQFYDHPETGEKMTWDNRGNGKGKWQIHHIKPFNSFDLNVEEQVKEVCHYTNMKSLWHVDHVKVHAKKYNKEGIE